jgi:23S rRNA pseudouridine1911/1915/1917 synthase
VTGLVVAIAPASAAGRRLDQVLPELVQGLTRTAGARLIASGDVLVGGEPAAPSRKLRGGEEIRVAVRDPAPSRLEPEDVPLRIVHEDDSIVVIDKPPGMIVHPGAGAARGTLVQALLHHCGEGLLGVGGERRPGIVHRLDKGTSGLIVVAKTAAAHAALSAQFARRTVGKTYLALARGNVQDEGRSDAPIGRSTQHRTRMAVGVPRARASLTTWRVVERFGRSAALLEVDLHTGRTHQVRVHLAHHGHPIVGDATYGPAVSAALDARLRPLLQSFPRPALHAWRLAIDHPVTGARLRLEAPLPEDFLALLEELRGALRGRSR